MTADEDIREKYAPEKVNELSQQTLRKDFDDMDREYLYILGDAFLQCGHIAKALKIFQFIEKIFPKDLHARKCIAYGLLILQSYQESLALVLELKQNKLEEISDATLSLILARIYATQGKMEEARVAMQDFIDIRKMHGNPDIQKQKQPYGP
ncbi:MAG: hypothetical protein KBE16_03300 [Alphaproteobacteria bacterium]|jgi:tetratricopeptide (TPR) repeat protein|nr:hypothetical protein [Alphaproteobacteria bacterium]MBP9877067.1 hypothetical protein [Alphaproteobacteria bacterium]